MLQLCPWIPFPHEGTRFHILGKPLIFSSWYGTGTGHTKITTISSKLQQSVGIYTDFQILHM